MPSFDVVSRTDLNEVDNAINGVRREIKQRFDLVGTKCAIDRTENALTMIADDSMKMRQLEDLLRKYLANRKVDQRSLEFQTPQNAAGGSLRQSILAWAFAGRLVAQDGSDEPADSLLRKIEESRPKKARTNQRRSK